MQATQLFLPRIFLQSIYCGTYMYISINLLWDKNYPDHVNTPMKSVYVFEMALVKQLLNTNIDRFLTSLYKTFVGATH